MGSVVVINGLLLDIPDGLVIKDSVCSLASASESIFEIIVGVSDEISDGLIETVGLVVISLGLLNDISTGFLVGFDDFLDRFWFVS